MAFSDEQITTLRDKLGIADDADEATILAKVDEMLEQVTAPDPDPKLPEGVVAISAEQLEALKADAQAGRDARAAQITAERTALVDAAVRDGRIAPAERDGWLAKLETGTGAENVLAALKPGLVPVNERGSNGEIDIEHVLDDEHGTYSKLFGTEVNV